jgi:peptidoglycan/LPS O-acetylase OafA/YrhL
LLDEARNEVDVPKQEKKNENAEPIERQQASAAMGYVPSLDGLRGVAIIGVLVFHTLPGALKGGFTGVDVFFVLSGYLISSVILHEIRRGSFTLKEFYLRRIQRLLPNAVLTVLFTVALSLAILLPSQAVKVAEHGLWTIFNLSNVYIWQSVGGYWGDSATSVPLLHTWSLAVEEQFYLVFPVILLFFSRRTQLFKFTACFALASLALSIYGTGKSPSATFYFLPTRAWEPLLGAALATFLVPAMAGRPLRRLKSSLWKEVAGWAGLAMIAAGFFIITEAHRFPGVIALIPTLGALAVLISVADGTTGPARLLSKPFPVLTGKLSYSLYLWHWPLIVVGREYADLTGRSQQMGTLLGAAAGMALAVMAYYAVEQPLRQRGPGRTWRLRVLATGFAVCAVACLALSLRHPVADPLNRFDRPTFSGNLYTVGPWDQAAVLSSTRFADVQFPEEGPVAPEMWNEGGIVHDWGQGRPRVVVLGSSHALMYGKLIDDICRELGVSVAFLSADETSVFFPTPVNTRLPTLELTRSFDAARKKWIRDWNPDAVLVIDRWDQYAGKPADFRQKLQGLFEEIAPHAGNVIVFSQVPVLRLGESVNLREYVSWHLRTVGQFPQMAPDTKESIRQSSMAAIGDVARDFPNVRLLRVDQPFYTEDGSVSYSSGRSFLYADDDHLSEAGAEWVREICERAIVAATRHPHGDDDSASPGPYRMRSSGTVQIGTSTR